MFTILHFCIVFAIQTFVTLSTPRHIVYLLFDDIGWSDIYATDGQFPTPNIDQLRSESVILNRHYIHYVCSISRTQFLTGRRATNSGYGRIETFKYTQIGGIPIGQPTVANWFRDFISANSVNHPTMPVYKTYGLAKWHVGYASPAHTPYENGFDKYYGFYQSGVDYKTKMHYHSKDVWGTNNYSQYDFFENENIAYSAVNVTTNTMNLYDDKIVEYLDDFQAAQASDPDINLYMYIGVQTLHGPLGTLPQYTNECSQFADTTALQRARICQYTYLTDNWVGDLKDNLVNYGLWDDTLLVFTADNGADIDVATCNYPLRGSKFSFFEGNIRQFTFVAGGAIPPAKYGSRETLVSNTDWTPTLLSYAGLLPFIDSSNYSWDGKDQWDMILNGDDTTADDSLIISINSPDISSMSSLNSYSIIFKYQWTTAMGAVKGDGHLYKYVVTDTVNLDSDKKWLNKITDGWCYVNFSNNRSIYVTELADSPYATKGKIKNNQFLFDLTDDEGETHNLMRLRKATGGKITRNYRNKLTDFAAGLIEEDINKQSNIDYYHEPIECLYNFHEEGNPLNFPVNNHGVQGLYIEPFYTTAEYLVNITYCLDSIDADAGEANIPTALRDLYENVWVPPDAIVPADEIYEMYQFHVNSNKEVEGDYISNSFLNNALMKIFGIVSLILVLFCMFLICGYKNISKKRGEYTPLLMNDNV